ncbi:unnamed protein product, partial [Nesidiocoris tenuis]
MRFWRLPFGTGNCYSMARESRQARQEPHHSPLRLLDWEYQLVPAPSGCQVELLIPPPSYRVQIKTCIPSRQFIIFISFAGLENQKKQ